MAMAQDGEPHQAHVQGTFQAYMQELEFRIDETNKEGDGPPLYFDGGSSSAEQFQHVITDLALQRCCGHASSDAFPAVDAAIDELQRY